MRRLRWSRLARTQLFEIANHYRELDPALAIDMLERIEACPAPLLDFPHIGSPTTDGTRKWQARKTPFILFYDVDDDAIEIVSIHHVRSNYPT